MKLHDKPRIELLYACDNIIIPCKKGQIAVLSDFIESVGEVNLEKEYTVTIEIKRQKRSLDANGYFWTLLKKLANKLNISYIEAYKVYIKDYGVYEVMPIRKDAVARWVQQWQSRGDGWICESLGDSKFEGYENIKCYYGSSAYDTKEMSRLIDAVVVDCKEQGIETMTPDELMRLKQQWNREKDYARSEPVEAANTTTDFR